MESLRIVVPADCFTSFSRFSCACHDAVKQGMLVDAQIKTR